MLLQERDYELLRLLAKTGAITFEQAQQVYNTKNYHYHRLIKLEKAGYIHKEGRYIQITGKGASLVGGEHLRLSPYTLSRYSKYAELIMNLKNYEAVSQKELRKTFHLEKRNNFQGGLRIDGKLYFVFILPDEPTRNKLLITKNEIEYLSFIQQVTPNPEVKNIQGAVVLTQSPKVLNNFPVIDYRALEVMLLPYPDGIEILDSWADHTYHQYLRSLIPKPNIVSQKPFAHYETPDAYHVFMMTNDLNKKFRLDAYFRAEMESKPVYLYCLEEQSEYFARQFPYAFIKHVSPAVPEEYIPELSTNNFYHQAVDEACI